MQFGTNKQVTHLTVWQLICLNGLSMPIALAGLVLVAFAPTYYAVNLGLGLGVVGAVFVAGRLLDVFTDPLIGYCSDQTRSRLGPRIPWILIGLPGFCMASWLLFSPPENATLLYLMAASGLYFLFYTMLDVPYSSIGLEISPHVNERSVIASYKALFQVAGALTAAAVPLFMVSNTTRSLSVCATLIIIFCGVGVWLFLRFVPTRLRVTTAVRPAFFSALKTTWKNRPFRILVIAFLVVQTANSLTVGLTVLFVTHVIEAPDLIGVFMSLVILASAAFLPLWVWISKCRSKASAWIWSLSLGCVVLAFTPLLGQGDTLAFSVVCILVGAAFGGDAVMPTSMLADIVYQDEVTGANHSAGLYLAVKNSVSKLTFLAPMGLAFPVLGLLGFSANAEHTQHHLFMLTFFYALLPMGLRLLAIFIVRAIPVLDAGIQSTPITEKYDRT